MEDTEEQSQKKSIGLASEICIWKDRGECGDCKLDEQLFCHPKLKYIAYFALSMMPSVITVVLGILFLFIDLWIKVFFFIGWVSYTFFFFNIWESRILCNHCPYYANDTQRILHCAIDKGKWKTGKYNPGPLNLSEKIQFFIGVGIFVGFPIPFLFILEQFILLIIWSIGIFFWFVVIQLKVCSECINFACPWNRVPKTVRDEFLLRNPIIKKVWEEKGYKIG